MPDDASGRDLDLSTWASEAEAASHQDERPVFSVPGMALIRVGDLEELFRRVCTAEQHAAAAESRWQEAQAEARWLRNRLAEVTAQVIEERESPPLRVERRHQADAVSVSERLRRDVRSISRELSPPEAGFPYPISEAWGPAEERGVDDPAQVKELVCELHRLYKRLQAYRSENGAPSSEPQRRADLDSYDLNLVATCRAIGIATSDRGERLSSADRVGLTRALARVGVDVRADPGLPA